MIAALKNILTAIAVSGVVVSASDMAEAATLAFNNLGQDDAYSLRNGAGVSSDFVGQVAQAAIYFEAQASGSIRSVDLALSSDLLPTEPVGATVRLFEGRYPYSGARSIGSADAQVLNRRFVPDTDYPLTSFTGFGAAVTKGGTYTILASPQDLSCKEPPDGRPICSYDWSRSLTLGEGAIGQIGIIDGEVRYLNTGNSLGARVSIVPLPGAGILLVAGLAVLGWVGRPATRVG